MGALTGAGNIPAPPDYGRRPDGSRKGTGWRGELRAGDYVVTEYSVGVNIGGKETDIPTITPYTTDDELKTILRCAEKGEPVPDSVVENAVRWARDRRKEGKSPFFEGTQDDIKRREETMKKR